MAERSKRGAKKIAVKAKRKKAAIGKPWFGKHGKPKGQKTRKTGK